MTDKEKFRKEVERLKSNLVYGACSSQVAMETRCKEEAYNEVLAILDTLQEEPIFKVGDTIQKKDNNSIRYSIINKTNDGYRALRGLSDTIVIWFSEQYQWELVKESVSEEWIEELRTKLDSMSKEDFRKVFDKYAIDFKEEPVSENLEEAIDTYLKYYWGGEKEKQDRPFLKKVAIYFAEWQKQQDAKILEFIITNGKDYPTLDSFLNTFKMIQYGKIKM